MNIRHVVAACESGQTIKSDLHRCSRVRLSDRPASSPRGCCSEINAGTYNEAAAKPWLASRAYLTRYNYPERTTTCSGYLGRVGSRGDVARTSNRGGIEMKATAMT